MKQTPTTTTKRIAKKKTTESFIKRMKKNDVHLKLSDLMLNVLSAVKMLTSHILGQNHSFDHQIKLKSVKNETQTCAVVDYFFP